MKLFDHLEAVLCLTATSMTPNISDLVADKQHRPSHSMQFFSRT